MKSMFFFGKILLTLLCLVVGVPLAMSFESIHGFSTGHSTFWWLAVGLGMVTVKILGVAIAIVIPQVFIWQPKTTTTQA